MTASSYSPKRRMTGPRRAFMAELERIGVGNPMVVGTTRAYLLKLGWVEWVLEMHDGSRMSKARYFGLPRASRPAWDGVTFVGVRLTADGRRALRESNHEHSVSGQT